MKKEQAVKAVIYARVSSKEQEKEGFSIPAQLKLLREYAAAGNFSIVEEYQDVETAKQAGRTNFMEMFNFLKQEAKRKQENICRVILVEKTDRLYRNIKDWVLLDDLDLEFHFVKENFVFSRESRSSEKFIHGIKVLMAKNYIDNLSEESRKGMLEKAEQGIYPSYAPLGYRNVVKGDKKFIEPDPEYAPFIKKVYEWYATGNYSLLEITRKARAEGFVFRRTKNPIAKSTIHKILTNTFYYGEFYWSGKIYKGNHEALIDRDLFERAQDVLFGRRGKIRQQKHSWAFQGLVSCGHCGCTMTAEIKKGRYVYYHCTGHKGKCPEKYVREEELAQQFGEALGKIRFDEEVLEWIITALRESHKDEKKYRDEMIARLQQQYSKIQSRLDAMYEDKLDGVISAEMFKRKSEEWEAEQAEILRKIEKQQGSNVSYLENGVRILELAQRAAELYERQDMSEKRKLLNLVFSNSTWKGGKLYPNFRNPFNLIVVTNEGYQKKTAALGGKAAGFDNWYRRWDSNPHLVSPKPDFESGASANSATPAQISKFNFLVSPLSRHCDVGTRLPIPPLRRKYQNLISWYRPYPDIVMSGRVCQFRHSGDDQVLFKEAQI